jgi:hypothetical protein
VRRLPLLALTGHGGAGAVLTPEYSPHAYSAFRQVPGTRHCKRGHPSGAPILKPCEFAVKGALCGRVLRMA